MRDWTKGSGLLGGSALAILLGVAGCADDSVAPPAATGSNSAPASAPRPTILPADRTTVAQSFPADANSPSSGTAATTLPNDPSAPADTPLCGIAARESNGFSQALLPRQYAEAGQCSAYACYDAATATYLGADGFRHVCR